MNLPQETLGFRRRSFSLRSRYSYRHSLLYVVHRASRYGFSQHTTLLYHALLRSLTSVSCFRFWEFTRLASQSRIVLPSTSEFRDRNSASIASVSRFSPGHFRRTTTRPVSYYALFKCVAASEPTSWLSLQSHILLHLTYI